MPKWKHNDFLPIVARLIEQRHRVTRRFIHTSEIEAQLLKDSEALELVDQRTLATEAFNIVAWFSARFTGCENGTRTYLKWKPSMDQFEREGTLANYAYKPVISNSSPVFADEIVETGNFREGTVRRVLVNAYERNPAARLQCLKEYGFKCFVCELSFAERYGRQFERAIHVHHLRPISDIGKEYVVNPITDLRPVCPNCHAMLHCRVPPYTVDEIRSILHS